jgi:hypothetical protein
MRAPSDIAIGVDESPENGFNGRKRSLQMAQ